METLTIAFEDKKLISVIKDLVNSMKGVSIVQPKTDIKQTKQDTVSAGGRYRIAPAIKAMESGHSLPDSISDNYKQEIKEMREQRYL